MKLNVLERITILSILPAESSFSTLRMIRDLASKVGLSADEMEEFEINQGETQVTWNDKGKEEREIELKPKEIEIIINALKDLDEKKKVTQRHVTLFEKFMEE